MQTKQTILLALALLVSTITFSQVGIGTEDPKATLDVVGKPANVSTADGIISPRLTGDELKAKDAAYGADNTGAMVYVTSSAAPTTTKTVNVVSEGYYYFDGAVWQRMTSKPSNLTTLQMNAIVNPIEGMEVYNSDAKCTFFYDGDDWRSRCTKIYQAAGPNVYRLSGTSASPSSLYPSSQILSVTFNSPGKARVNISGSAIHATQTNGTNRKIGGRAYIYLNSITSTALTFATSNTQNTGSFVHRHSTTIIWSMEVDPGEHTIYYEVRRTGGDIDMNAENQVLVVEVN